MRGAAPRILAATMSAKRPARIPLEFRLAYLLPIPPVAAGFVWTGTLCLVSWAIAKYSGVELVREQAPGQHELTDLAILMFVSCLILGMLPAISRLTTAGELWDLGTEIPPIEPRKRWKAERMKLVGEFPTLRPMLLGSFLGLVVGVAITVWMRGTNLEHWKRASTLWSGVLMTGMFVLMARGVVMTHHTKKRRAPVFAAAEVVDLLDLGPQHRAGRCAVRTCVTWLAGASFSSLFFQLGGTLLTTSILIFVTAIAMLAALPPVLRMQRLIHNAKVVEIARLQEDVRFSREAVLRSTRQGEATQEPGRLADLLAYLHYVESLPELPFDKSKLAIASLYFAVPLFSWLIISVVQSLIGLSLT
jgi:hypothetical protein